MSLPPARPKMTSLSVELFAHLKCAIDPPAAAVSAIASLGIHAARGAHEVLMRRAR